MHILFFLAHPLGFLLSGYVSLKLFELINNEALAITRTVLDGRHQNQY